MLLKQIKEPHSDRYQHQQRCWYVAGLSAEFINLIALSSEVGWILPNCCVWRHVSLRVCSWHLSNQRPSEGFGTLPVLYFVLHHTASTAFDFTSKSLSKQTERSPIPFSYSVGCLLLVEGFKVQNPPCDLETPKMMCNPVYCYPPFNYLLYVWILLSLRPAQEGDRYFTLHCPSWLCQCCVHFPMALFLWVCLCCSIDSFKLTCFHLHSCQLFFSSLALAWCCLNRSAACQLGCFGAWMLRPSGRQWDCSTDSLAARTQALREVQLCNETLQTLSKFSWVHVARVGNGSKDDILCSMNWYTGVLSVCLLAFQIMPETVPFLSSHG